MNVLRGRMWSTADRYQWRRSHSELEVDRWVYGGRRRQMLTTYQGRWRLLRDHRPSLLTRQISRCEQIRWVQLAVGCLQWAVVRRRSDVRLECDKCKHLQNLRECRQISDESVVLVFIGIQSSYRLLQQWRHKSSAHWSRELTWSKGDASQTADDGWNLFLTEFHQKGTDMMSWSKVVLGASKWNWACVVLASTAVYFFLINSLHLVKFK